MADKYTRIKIPGAPLGSGLMDHGEKSASEMIAAIRASADYDRRRVELIDATRDDQFQIDVVRGCLVQHHIREVQASSKES